MTILWITDKQGKILCSVGIKNDKVVSSLQCDIVDDTNTNEDGEKIFELVLNE